MPVSDNQNATFFLLLGALGAALGIAATVSALTSDDFNGRVYLFLPTIILGMIGMFVGSLIDGAIHNGRKPDAATPSSSSSPDIGPSVVEAFLLDRGLITQQQLDTERTTPSLSSSPDIGPSAFDALSYLADLLDRGLITQQHLPYPIIAKLRYRGKIADLLDRGLITQQQFDTERDRLLGHD